MARFNKMLSQEIPFGAFIDAGTVTYLFADHVGTTVIVETDCHDTRTVEFDRDELVTVYFVPAA